MEKMFFISIDDSEEDKITYYPYGFKDIETARQGLKEVVENYKKQLIEDEMFDDDFIEEFNNDSWFTTDNCGVYITIQINSVEIP